MGNDTVQRCLCVRLDSQTAERRVQAAEELRRLLDKMKVTVYLEYPLCYKLGLFLVLGGREDGIELIEAKLADQEIARTIDEDQRHAIWVEGRDLLTERTGKGLRLKRSNVDQAAARRLAARLDEVYNLQDVRRRFASDRVHV